MVLRASPVAHDSYPFFGRLGDPMRTAPTRTKAMDI